MNDLIFENSRLSLIEFNGSVWLKSSDIAKALGYKNIGKMSRIYNLHKDEFSASMSVVIEMPVSGMSNLVTETRLFSLRGAHLLGMFARTSKGVAFRKWVLDQLDSMEQKNKANHSLIAEFYRVSADLESQNKFASMCGKGLSEHKKKKPALVQKVFVQQKEYSKNYH